MRGIFFDLHALVYGPEGADLLAEVLRAEEVYVEPVVVTEALGRLPAELKAMRDEVRTEEQENDYNRTLIPALMANLGYREPNLSLIHRLVELLYDYSAFYSMYPETLPVLAELKNRGYAMAVVANWDPSLGRLIREFELDPYISAAVSSREVGLAKPDPYIFHKALKQVGLAAGEVMHVGSSLRIDVTGATSAGITPVWLNRTGIPTGHDVLTINDLRGLLMLAPKAGEQGWN